METYIEIKGVYKYFKQDMVLEDINVTMEKGRVYGFVGNNGSGKTVLMKCICGFLTPSKGSITVNGLTIGQDIDFPQNTGVIIETPGFLPHISGQRNLEILAGLNKKIGMGQIRDVLHKVGLSADLKKSVAQYSLGMRQRLGIAQAIMENPEFLILDEPFNGLDKNGVEDIRNIILELKEQEKTIILSSHNSDDIDILCDQVYEMDGGRIKEL